MLHMLDRKKLLTLYRDRRLSMQEIAHRLHCSVHKVSYWMKKYKIRRRSISDAIYLMHNPCGDPFHFRRPQTREEMFLFGLGIGLYWGEGTKSNKSAVRLGNSDPSLMNKFLEFLTTFFGVRRGDFRFGLQIFSDMDPKEALRFWTTSLHISEKQFQKVIVTRSGSLGTYRQKIQHGVLTVHYNNIKLRNLLISFLPA